MRKDCEDSLQPGQPALIVTYGNTTRKHRPLDRDVLVLGRAPSCDVSLVSPEVAPIHCLIHRLADGWCIRDCSGGRHATRVNGRAIHEEMLHDGDVVQIGTFTFEARLPAARPTPVPNCTPVVEDHVAARVKRLLRSRRNLVRLALRLRQRARCGNPVAPSLAELERQAECLRGLQRDYEKLLQEYESRLEEVEKAEREICDERAAFERECSERRTRLEKAEHEMVRRQAVAEAQIKQRCEECQQRCRQVEQAHAPFLQALPEQDASASAAASQELARVLDRRSQELNCFARHLRRCRQQLHEQSAELTRLRDEIHIAKERTIRPGSLRDRLANIHRLKQELAATSSPSAPGDQRRPAATTRGQ